MVEKLKNVEYPRGFVVNGQLPMDTHPTFFLPLAKKNNRDPIMGDYTRLRLREHLFNHMGMDSGRSFDKEEPDLMDLMEKIRKIEKENPEIQALFTWHVNFMIEESRRGKNRGPK